MSLNFVNDFYLHHIWLVLGALVLDGIMGDPVYAWHPIRLVGKLLQFFERVLFSYHFNTKLGGVLLGVLLTTTVFSIYYLIYDFLVNVHPVLIWLGDLFLVMHMLALKDLLAHARRISEATLNQNLSEARYHSSRLVGRDVDKMDLAGCNRAAIESVSESLVDGVISPLFYLLIGGVPGMLFFKIVSTMDSMVGYKNSRYLYFGWCGARMDDVLNWVPARLTWLLMSLVSLVKPGLLGVSCFTVGLKQHSIIPGPNAGWSECAMAGSLGIRIAGPIYKKGNLVNELWLGDKGAPEGGSAVDVQRANNLAVYTTFLFVVLVVVGGLVLNYFSL